MLLQDLKYFDDVFIFHFNNSIILCCFSLCTVWYKWHLLSYLQYKAIVFRPFKGEVLDAVVTQINKIGLFCEIGPMQCFISRHVSQLELILSFTLIICFYYALKILSYMPSRNFIIHFLWFPYNFLVSKV